MTATPQAAVHPDLPAVRTAAVADVDRRKEVHNLHFTLAQSVRNTYSVGLIALFVTLPAWRVLPAWLWGGWLAATTAAYALRARALRPGAELARVQAQPEAWSLRLAAWSLGAGAVAATGPLLLYPGLDDVSRMYVCMLYCCWLAGAMASLGARPRLFLAYALVFMGGLGVAWLRSDSAYQGEIAVMLALYTVVLTGFARNFARQVDAGVEIRFVNEHLIEQLTRAREQAEQASEAKSRFLAVASHDLRQPLHAVMLLNGMLGRPQPPARIHEISQQMGRSLATLERLFGSVLDFSRIEADKVRPDIGWHPLPPLIEQLEPGYAAQAAQKGLVFEARALPVSVRTDPQLLERILRNLLENAIKFSDAGTVRLEAEATPQGGLRLAVSDTGPGIPGNLREEIFKEYFQTAGDKAAAGLGLGLAIVRGLATLLELTVRVTDAAPQGARFEVVFGPAQVGLPTGADARPSGEPAGAVDLRGFFVVYVDDDVFAQEAVRMLLDDWGCRTVVAGSLAQALALTQETGPPDAVLSDYSLRGGETGVQVIEGLRARHGPVAGAILTGESLAMQRELAAQLEFPVLGKPVTPAELRDLLEVFKGIG